MTLPRWAISRESRRFTAGGRADIENDIVFRGLEKVRDELRSGILNDGETFLEQFAALQFS